MTHQTHEALVKPGDLTPHPMNPRTHPEEQMDVLAKQLAHNGILRRPVVTDDNVILAGHGVVQASIKAGFNEIPVTVVEDIDESERLAYVAADNQLGDLSGNDFSKLQAVMLKLVDEEYKNMDLMGFQQAEIDKMLKSINHTDKDPDKIPEAPDEPVSRLGDLWELGQHRLICGDSTDVEAVERLLGDIKPNLMVTDPPYGVEYQPNWRADSGRQEVERGDVLNDDRADWYDAYSLFPGNIAYVWHASLHSDVFKQSLEKAAFKCRSQIIWAKSRFAISRGHYHWQHEPCWYATRGTAEWQGSRKESTIWNIDVGDLDSGHGTQKPVECMKRPIEHNSSIGMAVYDPFLGSGTTLIASELTGRICYGIELNPTYVDVIVTRWEEVSGEKAYCDGLTIEELEEQRRGT